MVQIHNLGPSRKSLLQESLGQALGQGLSNFTNQYFAGKALDSVVNDKAYETAPMGERASRLQRAMMPYGEMGASVLQNRMQVEQQMAQEQEQRVLGKIAQGKDVSEQELARLSPENQFKAIQAKKVKAVGNQVRKALIDADYDKDTADLWANQVEHATTGGQTDALKHVNDLLRRSKAGKGLQGQEEKNILKPSIEIPGIETKSYELDFPELKQNVGRTSADLVKEEGKNREINTPLYSSTIDKLDALDEDFRDLAQMQEYNETPGALPTGGEKWNVDWDTGDLRVKAMATPETQAYIKSVSRLIRKAKEYYPGRVTNFDLEQFKSGFPTLANSPEGRALITKQLMTANRIAYLKDETLKSAIDHYGSEADPAQIRRYANDNYRRLKGQLEGELKDLNKQSDQMMKGSEKILTDDVMDRYLQMANDNPDQAAELARKDGYEF